RWRRRFPSASGVLSFRRSWSRPWLSLDRLSCRSNERIISPLQQRLPLPRPATHVARLAVGTDLAGVAGKTAPAGDLLLVDVLDAAAEIIAAIPLEPAARIGTDDPALLPPDGERLPALDAEAVDAGVGGFRKLGSREPAL